MLSGLIRFHFRRPVDALQTSATHHELNLVVADRDAATEGELGMDALDAINAARLRVDLRDQVGSASRAGSHAQTAACGSRRSQPPTPQGPGRPPGREGPQRRSPRSPRTSFWVGLLLEDLDRSTCDRKLGLELSDALLGRT